MSTPFGRLLTAMVTPFTADHELDLAGARTLARQLIEDGNDGLVVCGTTGESPTLSGDEKDQLWRAVKEAIGSERPLIAGTGSNCTRSTVELSRRAQNCGADGLLLVAPYYNKPSGRGLFEHFRTIHDATELPIMLYNIPGRCGIEIPVDVLFELAELPRVVAVKQSLPIDPVSRLISKIRAAGDRRMATYSGDDSQTLPQLSVGGVGVVSVAGHLVAGLLKQKLELFFSGRVAEAAELHQRLFPLFEALFVTSNPVPVKCALAHLGRPAGSVRAPLAEISESERATILGALKPLELVS